MTERLTERYWSRIDGVSIAICSVCFSHGQWFFGFIGALIGSIVSVMLTGRTGNDRTDRSHCLPAM